MKNKTIGLMTIGGILLSASGINLENYLYLGIGLTLLAIASFAMAPNSKTKNMRSLGSYILFAILIAVGYQFFMYLAIFAVMVWVAMLFKLYKIV